MISAVRSAFYGWKLLVVLWVALAINFALSVYGLGILNVHMGDELGINRAALGTAYATFMLMTGLPGPLVAKMIERVGIRRTLMIGNFLLVIGAVAMATIVTSPVTLLLFAGLVIGAANAIAGPIPVQAAITRWFSRKRSLAMALVISGVSVGGVIFPPVLEHISAEAGWRTAWWLVALLSLGVTLLCATFVKESPSDLGQQPDGEEVGSSLARQDEASKSNVYQTTEDWLPRDVIRERKFWTLLACAAAVSAVYTIFLAQGVLHIRDLGYSTEVAAYLLSGSVGIGFVLRLVAGLLGDRIDPKYMWAAALLCQGAGIALFAEAHDAWTLYLAVGLIGIGDGVAILCLIMVFGNWFGVRAAPFVFGFGSAIAAAFGALAPIATGFCYDLTGTFTPAFYIVAVLCAVASIVVATIQPPRLSSQ